MNNQPLFETSYAGSKVTVYKSHIEWKMLFKKKSIPISQVASVELGSPLYAQVIIETAGGKKFKIPVAPGKKKPLHDAILHTQA